MGRLVISQLNNSRSGQTIIETMIAIFVLTSGIMAVYALSEDNNTMAASIRSQAIGVGLAREGIEAVKNMRDTNWLIGADSELVNSDQLVSVNVNGAPLASIGSKVHRDWLNPNISTGKYVLENGSLMFDQSTADIKCGEVSTDLGKNIILEHSNAFAGYMNASLSANSQYWTTDTGGLLMKAKTGTVAESFRLRFNDQTYAGGNPGAFYQSYFKRDGTNNAGYPSQFYRSICLKKYNNKHPFSTTDFGPLIEVTSRVWWLDNKKCRTSSTPENYTYDKAQKTCKIQLKTQLTNWKPD